MARRRSSGSGTTVAVGLGLAAIAIAGVAVVATRAAQAAPAQPTPTPQVVPTLPAMPAIPPPGVIPIIPSPVPTILTPPTTSSTTLQPGHRYSVAQLAPLPGMPVLSVAQAQSMFDAIAPGAIRVVSIMQGSGTQPTTLVVDVLQGVPLTIPSTMPVTDLGPSR
jgi:hypothetical protein